MAKEFYNCLVKIILHPCIQIFELKNDQGTYTTSIQFNEVQKQKELKTTHFHDRYEAFPAINM